MTGWTATMAIYYIYSNLSWMFWYISISHWQRIYENLSSGKDIGTRRNAWALYSLTCGARNPKEKSGRSDNEPLQRVKTATSTMPAIRVARGYHAIPCGGNYNAGSVTLPSFGGSIRQSLWHHKIPLSRKWCLATESSRINEALSPTCDKKEVDSRIMQLILAHRAVGRLIFRADW